MELVERHVRKGPPGASLPRRAEAGMRPRQKGWNSTQEALSYPEPPAPKLWFYPLVRPVEVGAGRRV